MPTLPTRLKDWAARTIIGKAAASQLTASFLRGEDMDEPALRRGLLRPYARSPWIMQAIQKIALPVSAVPVEFYEVSGEEAEVKDAAFDAFWRAPAIDTAGGRLPLADANAALVGWWKLSGEFFLVLDATWTGRFLPIAARSPFLIARPDKMRHILDGDRIVGWCLTDAKGKQITLLPEQVIHRKRFNPYDAYRGLSEFEAASLTAESDYLAAQFGKNLNAANGDQGVYVVAKQGITDDAQREQIEAALMEKQRRQQAGLPTVTFVNGDVAVQDPQIRGFDVTTLTSRLQNRQEIAVAFGLPASSFEVKAAYSIGSASDEYQVIANVSKPTAAILAGAFSVVGSRLLNREVEACFDWDDHPTMQAVRRERIDTALKLWGTGMPMDEVSDYLDLGLPEYPGSDVGYLPFSVSPVDTAPADPTLPAPGADVPPVEAEPADPIEAMKRALRCVRTSSKLTAPSSQLVPADPLAMFCCAAHGEIHAKAGTERDPKRVARWRAAMAERRKTVKAYKSRITSELMKARAETLKAISTNWHGAALRIQILKDGREIMTRATAADFIFNLGNWAEALQASLRSVARDALDTAGAQVFAEIGRDDPFKYPPEAVLEHLRTRQNYIAKASTSIWENIKESIEEGLNAGDTQDQLAARVRTAFNGVSDQRAQMIALTETGAAYGAGRDTAMRSAGIEYKQWLTSGNGNVRPAHLDAEGQTVRIDEPFNVGGEDLMHPGESGGSAENVINCHCISIAVEGPDS